jgi:spoIIIJ-associated protein
MSSSSNDDSDPGTAGEAHATFSEHARAYGEAFAAASGLDLTAQVTADDADGLVLAFDGPDAHLLAARRGQVLDALQLLATYSLRGASHRSGPRPPRLTCDADGYRAKRKATLYQMAHALADEVKSSGQEAVLDPLSPLERRIVHTALADDPGVMTYSEGEEPDRYIIISPRV